MKSLTYTEEELALNQENVGLNTPDNTNFLDLSKFFLSQEQLFE